MPAKRVPVVAVNSKGEIAGYYESILEAGKMNGISPCSIANAVRLKRFCRKLRWMREEDYRVYWMEGRTDELRGSYKEYITESKKRARRNMSEESVESWKRHISESYKDRIIRQPELIERRMKPIKCLVTGERFESISAAAKVIQDNPSNICRAIKDRRKIKGFLFEYV